MDTITAQTPAKLNLALTVGPPVDGGMHPICSWMIPISLCDELQVTRLPGGTISRYATSWHPDARMRKAIDWPVAQDIAVRAHIALEHHIDRPLPVQMNLRKRIPVGGGLGGGSSDAGAMLTTLNTLFDLRLADNDLRTIAATLGSDVPFFISPCDALISEFGERVERLDPARDLDAAVILPGVACSTASVYRRFDERTPSPLDDQRIRRLAASPPDPASLFNDLTGAAFSIAPVLADLATEIESIAGSPAHLSGSGSSLFVICNTQQQAISLAATIERSIGHPAVPVTSCNPPT